MANWIRWNGDVQDGGTVNQSIPSSTGVEWGDNSYTWGDVQFISDIADGIGTGSRRARQDRLNKILDKEPEKKKRLIHLICRIDGTKVYDGEKEVNKETSVSIEKVEMLIKEVLGKVKIKNVI